MTCSHIESQSPFEAPVPCKCMCSLWQNISVKRLLVCCQQCALLFNSFIEPNLTCEEDEVTKAGGNQNLYVSNPQV